MNVFNATEPNSLKKMVKKVNFRFYIFCHNFLRKEKTNHRESSAGKDKRLQTSASCVRATMPVGFSEGLCPSALAD